MCYFKSDIKYDLCMHFQHFNLNVHPSLERSRKILISSISRIKSLEFLYLRSDLKCLIYIKILTKKIGNLKNNIVSEIIRNTWIFEHIRQSIKQTDSWPIMAGNFQFYYIFIYIFIIIYLLLYYLLL